MLLDASRGDLADLIQFDGPAPRASVRRQGVAT